ncbi:MAG TPA: hypothetical protein VH044_02780, partial [Polyangiaceae bacterium]|nr:hypothetical protein [Polyangiaceae bacterium]
GSLMPCRVPHRDLRRQLYLLVNKHKYRGQALALWLALCGEGADGRSRGGQRQIGAHERARRPGRA